MEDKNSKTLENHIIMCGKDREKIKLLQRRVDTLYVIVGIFIIYELFKILF